MNSNRYLYIDNLRLLMIVFVVLMHIAVTYSGFGGWYYKEPGEIETIQTIFFGFYQAFTQAYFLGLLFLIAGFFTPGSYDKKGFGKFIKDRSIRLGIPAIIYMLLIHPILNFIILGHRFEADSSFLAAYREYLLGFHFIGGNGPLWFVIALLIFSIIYALLRKCIARKTLSVKDFPALIKIIILVLLISTCTFLVRLVQPLGTDIYNMQLGYFSQYIILFVVGIYCKRNDWFEKINYKYGKPWFIGGISLGFISFACLMILGGGLDGDLSPFEGGLTWQSAAFALWESFVAIAMSIGLITLFKEKFNMQNNLIKTLSKNAFSVYVFHSVIIVSLSLLFSPVKLIPIAKFIIMAMVGIPICFLVTYYTIQRITFLRKIF